MPIPLLVTKRYQGQRVTSWWQPATQTNRDQNRYKNLARCNQPQTSETYRRQDDVFGHELQFLLSGVLSVFQNRNYKLQSRLPDVLPKQRSHQKIHKRFSSSRRVTRRQVMRHFTGHGTNQCRNGSSDILITCREQPRSTRTVVAYPRPAFSATKRTNHARISFDQRAQVYQGHASYTNREN